MLGIIWSLIQRACNRSKPQLTHDATVVKKGHSGGFVPLIYGISFMWVVKPYVTFELISDGSIKKVCVSEDEYKTLTKGDCGILTLQGKRYIGFTTPPCEAPTPGSAAAGVVINYK